MINIIDKHKCCGCGSCAQRCPKQCISLKEDNEGFLYPHVQLESCSKCGLCEKVCPFLNPYDSRKPIKVLAAINNNSKIRSESSSGGIFTLIAESIIKDDGVVFGARFDDEWQVVLDCTETIEGLSVFRGSKYVQARTGDAFIKCEMYLKQGRKVLFTGTPCQISGLNRFLKKAYSSLYTLDVVCHGVPSPGVWRKYLLQISNMHGKINSVLFRSKQNGWANFSLKIKFNNRATTDYEYMLCEPHNNNTYMRAFLSDLILRPSCHNCQAKSLKHLSDFSLADFWGVENVNPLLDDDQGVSLILLNTPKAQKIFSELKCTSEEVSYEVAYKYNSAMRLSSKPHHYRDHFFRRYMQDCDICALINNEFSPGLLQKIMSVPGRVLQLLKNK